MAARKPVDSAGFLREWATERLYLDPDGSVTLAEMQRDILMYASDRHMRPVYTGLAAMLSSANPTLIKRKLKPEIHYTGVSLRPVPDSGYRVPHQRP